MWMWTRFLLLILPLISPVFFLSNFQISKICCIMYIWIRLLVFIYSIISLIFFFSNSKTLNFCHTFLWGLRSWNLIHTWQRVDLMGTPNSSSQNVLVPLLFFCFLSLQLAKIKNLHLQNCFSIPLLATALLPVCYIFYLLMVKKCYSLKNCNYIFLISLNTLIEKWCMNKVLNSVSSQYAPCKSSVVRKTWSPSQW